MNNPSKRSIQGTNHWPGAHSRRDVLRMGAAGGAFAMASGARAMARPQTGGGRDTLVLVFLRGGADALSMVVPTQEAALYAARPTLGVSAQNTTSLDGFFGLNEVGARLLPWYLSGNLAFVHAVGSPNPTRSHFEAMRRLEQGAMTGGVLQEGWLARHLRDTAPPTPTSSARAIAIDRTLPTVMQGGPAALPILTLAEFGLGGPPATRLARAGRLETMMNAAPLPDGPAGLTNLSTIEQLAPLDFGGRPLPPGVDYPPTKFGQSLYEAATLIKSGAPVEAIEVDSGGWDHHGFLGPLDGRFALRLRELSWGLDGLMSDLGGDADRVTIVVMSEFGRRVDENGSGGFDHGRGGVAMVLGGSHVNGGVVHSNWPGLEPADLDGKALAVTTDIRDVISEVLVKRMNTANLAVALPNYTPSFLGLVN